MSCHWPRPWPRQCPCPLLAVTTFPDTLTVVDLQRALATVAKRPSTAVSHRLILLRTTAMATEPPFPATRTLNRITALMALAVGTCILRRALGLHLLPSLLPVWHMLALMRALTRSPKLAPLL